MRRDVWLAPSAGPMSDKLPGKGHIYRDGRRLCGARPMAPWFRVLLRRPRDYCLRCLRIRHRETCTSATCRRGTKD